MEYSAASLTMPVTPEKVAEEAERFELVLRAHRAKVFRFILASLRDRDVAETLTQDCFFKAYQARHRFRHECSLDTWLMQIAVNLVRDHARNRRLQFWKRAQLTAEPVESAQHYLSDKSRSAEGSLLLNEQVQAIWAASEALPERQRTVFLLRFVEEMELLEIAAATGMKEGTVKVHLFRALQAVRGRMGVRR